MARTITVKGVGTALVKPDQVELRLTLEAKDRNYDKAMEMAAEQIAAIKAAVENAGFEKDCLKTTNFHVNTVYDRVRDKNQNYITVFGGYECSHTLKLVFDFDSSRLSGALSAVAQSGVNPEIQISFTVKNPEAVNALILQDAAANARQKAEILCAASGVKLGKLLTIDYNWAEVNFVSRTTYNYGDCMVKAAAPSAVEIDPDDIKASDSAAFVWEIE